MGADCLQLELDIREERLYCWIEGPTDLESSKQALAELAAVLVQYQAAELLIVDQTWARAAKQATRAQQFELALYFSEWFRGVTVAVVVGNAERDWELMQQTCRANDLLVKMFDDLAMAEQWLLIQQSASQRSSDSTPISLPFGSGPKLD